MDEIRPRERLTEDLEVDDPSWGPPPPRSGFPVSLVVALLIAAALLTGLVYWLAFRPPPAAPAAVAAAESLPTARPAAAPAMSLTPPDPVPAVVLPRLDASDEAVRAWISALSSRPELARWLVGEHLVRRFVAAVDNIAEGAHPRSHLPVSRLEDPFVVAESMGGPVITATSFARYDGLVGLFESIDPRGAAQIYFQLRPLIEQAYADLGYPGRKFDDTLVVAIRHLMATPVPPQQPALEQKIATYRWADPKLEGLSPAQRQLLRTGPENVRRIQEHLRRVAAALGVPADPL